MTTTATTPAISVIVPVYNTERYLRRCIDSILAQTFTDFELLLIDDGSTDASPAICDEYAQRDPRVRVFHKPNGGVSSARNLGLDNAIGEWISFVDADDWVDDVYFATLLKDATDTSDIIISNFIEISDAHTTNNEFKCNNLSKVEIINKLLTSYGGTCLWGRIFRHSVLKNNDLRCPDGISFCEDFLLSAKAMVLSNNIIVINEPLYYYYQNRNSICHTQSERQIIEAISMNNQFIEFLKKNNSYNPLKKSMAWRYIAATQNWATDIELHKQIKNIYPEKNQYILGCTLFYNWRQHFFYWLATHNMSKLLQTILRIRSTIKLKILHKK